ncbi:MAG: tyrosine-type recombinase/integrase [Phycisphaerae bacterium]
MAQDLREVPSDRPETVAGAVDKWLILNPKPAYEQWLAQFVTYAGKVFLDDIGNDFLTRYLINLKAFTYHRGKRGPTRHLSNETIRHYIRTATAVLRWAHKQGWAGTMPEVPKLDKSVKKARDVDLDRLKEILEGLPERAGRILRFIASTGCRPSEACRLKWSAVRLDDRRCILTKHKTANETGEVRTIFLTDEAASILRTMPPTIGYVFTNRYGQPYKPNGLRSILKRHGDITPYRLRHTFAQHVSDGGVVPIEVLARLMGHTDTKTTGFYFKVRDKRAIGAAKTIKFPTAVKTEAAAG